MAGLGDSISCLFPIDAALRVKQNIAEISKDNLVALRRLQLTCSTYNVFELGQNCPGKITDQHSKVKGGVTDIGDHDDASATRIVGLLLRRIKGKALVRHC